jgi:hypothetical protein
MIKQALLVSLIAFSSCGVGNNSTEGVSIKKPLDPIDSVLAANSGIEVQYGQAHVDSTYQEREDTAYQFQSTPINFIAKYYGSFNKYACAMGFVDTINKISYTWQKLQPGATEWGEETHVDFSALVLIRDTTEYYLPEDLTNTGFTAIKDIKYGDTVLLDINAELITGIDGNPVIPTLLIKNVKKMQ